MKMTDIIFQQCSKCKPLYNNKPFRKSDSNNTYKCLKCNCNEHADSCHYDVTFDEYPQDFSKGGGGVCDNCKHNTEGMSIFLLTLHLYSRSYHIIFDMRPYGLKVALL